MTTPSADDLVIAPDLTPARWIPEALHSFGVDIGSVVPPVFADYARILHPAYAAAPDGGDRRVRWSEIAEAKGRPTHPGIQFPTLVGLENFLNGPDEKDCWSEPPAQGTLPAEITTQLVDVLAEHTSTPDRCWFAVWDGFGDSLVRERTTSRLAIPGRDLVLVHGPIQGVLGSLGHARFQSANLWWPDDRAWCVATDIDFVSTYLGGTRRCVDAVLDRPELETFRVSAEDPIRYDSDSAPPTE